MENCSPLLEASLKRAQKNPGHSFIHDEEIAARVVPVVSNPNNRAGVRLLMACMLAKVHRPEVDPRKPYTKIRSKDCFSGRSYDEQFINEFSTRHNLWCNPTTAFLTPTLRNMDQTLTTKVVLVGRPAAMYQEALRLLDDVRAGRVGEEQLESTGGGPRQGDQNRRCGDELELNGWGPLHLHYAGGGNGLAAPQRRQDIAADPQPRRRAIANRF
jgi:DNA adenine methylase